MATDTWAVTAKSTFKLQTSTEGEAILLMLDKFGICASSGSACTSGSLEPSHVLRAMGVPFTAAHGSIRFSLSRYNTEEEVDYTIEKMPAIINRLRELSPCGQAVRMGNWKGIRQGSKGKLELYDLKADIGETTSIANQNPEIVAKIEEYINTAHTPSQLFPLL